MYSLSKVLLFSLIISFSILFSEEISEDNLINCLLLIGLIYLNNNTFSSLPRTNRDEWF
jgi:hypothetical protein